VDPAGHSNPRVQVPVQLEDVRPGVAPYVPAGHGNCTWNKHARPGAQSARGGCGSARCHLPPLPQRCTGPAHRPLAPSAGGVGRPRACCSCRRPQVVDPHCRRGSTAQARHRLCPGHRRGTCTPASTEGTYDAITCAGQYGSSLTHAWLELEPRGQKNPAVQGPLQPAVLSRSAHPNLPAGQGLRTPSMQ